MVWAQPGPEPSTACIGLNFGSISNSMGCVPRPALYPDYYRPSLGLYMLNDGLAKHAQHKGMYSFTNGLDLEKLRPSLE